MDETLKIMLREEVRHKDHILSDSNLYEMSKKGKFIEKGNRLVVARV